MRSFSFPWSFERLERGLFATLLGLHLVPVWAFRYFATADGPAHLYNAWVLKAMLLDPDSRFHALFRFNLNPEPNYLSHALLAGLLTMLPPWLAEKAVLTLYVAGLPLAVRYLVRGWQPAAGFLAVLAFPLVYSAVLQFGFYNFCLSLVLLALVLGYWKRHFAPPPTPPAGRRRAQWRLMGLVSGLYLAHPLAYLTGGLLLGLLSLEQALKPPAGRGLNGASEPSEPIGPTGPGRSGLGRRLLAALGPVAWAFRPTLPLLGWYLWRQGGAGGAAAPAAAASLPQVAERLHDWLTLEPLRYMGQAEGSYRLMLTAWLLAALLYAAWQHSRGRALAPAGAWALGVLLLGLGYTILPESLAGGSIIRPRLALLSYLALLGALATVPYSAAMRRALLLAGSVVATVFLGFRFGRYQTLHTGLDEYRSAAAHLRPGRTLVPLRLAHVTHMPNGREYGSYIDVFAHAAGYLAVERDLSCLENYEARVGYFPLRWRPGQDRLSQPDSLPNRLDLAPRPAAPAPDYVLLWGAPDTARRAPANTRYALRQLAEAYRPIYRSPTGLVLLYEHRPPAPSAR